MPKPLILALFAALCTLALTCKKEPPVVPPNGGPDTTSHNFTFALDTLGDGNSSVLNDVFIISETNVIAVGEIFLRDSLGGFGDPPYGIARWDGSQWRFVRLIAVGPGGFTFHITPIRGIWAFSPTDIWLAAGAVFRWNGQTITPYYINHFPGNPNPILDPGQTAEKLWGTSSSNLYAVGRQGAIAHFNGSSWTKLTSGTTVDIQDIYGAVDARTGETEILAVASYVVFGQGLALLEINGTTVSQLDTAGLRIAQSSVWFMPGARYYVVGDGVFTKASVADARWQLDPLHPPLYKASMRGSSWNDAFIVGAFGLVSHYNGSTFKHYTGDELPSLNGSYYSVRMTDNLMVAVGDLANGRTIVLRGKRH